MSVCLVSVSEFHWCPAKFQRYLRFSPVCREFALSLAHDLSDDDAWHIMHALMGESGEAITVGSLFSGSEYCWDALTELLDVLGEICGIDRRPRLIHKMVCEIEAWKRSWIMQGPCPELVFGDAKDIVENEKAWDFNSGSFKTVPSVNWLGVGWSCCDLSTLRQARGQFSRVVADGNGKIGVTAKYAIAYISKHRCSLVLLENVKGLMSGRFKRDGISLQIMQDLCSNLFVLVRAMVELGYVVPYAAINAAPRSVVRRVRSWLPCVNGADFGVPTEKCVVLSKLAVQLMEKLSVSPESQVVTLARLQLEEDADDFDLWLAKANHAGSHEDGDTCAQFQASTRKRPTRARDWVWKWKELHRSVFESRGLTWPPVVDTDLAELASSMGMTEREIETVHFFDIVDPMDLVFIQDRLLDLSQAILRCSAIQSDTLMCLTPNARLFWRRARRSRASKQCK